MALTPPEVSDGGIVRPKMTQTNHHALPIWQKIVALALVWLASVGIAHAQAAGTGVIQGRVFNPVTKEYVRNAEVQVQGTNIVAVSEDDGSYRLSNVPPGAATVTLNYTGYKADPASVNVTAGQVATRDFEIVSIVAPAAKAEGPLQLQAFTVSTEREGNSKAIMEQKRNMNITTSVASDVFGDVTDGNVGEFLKFLPGVDVDYVESETRGPRLGGLDAQYTAVSFDGTRLASADANRTGDLGRATSFEAFSISAVESIEISRTSSPDMDADAPGGTINMKMRKAFDRKGRRISYNFSLNMNSEEFTLSKTYGPGGDKDYKARPNYSFEYSESFNNRFGVVLSFNRVDSYTEQYRHNLTYNLSPTVADPRPMVVTALNFKDGAKNIAKDTYTLTTDWKVTPRLVLTNALIYNYALGQFYNRELTFNVATNNANGNTGRQFVQGDGVNTVRTNGLAANTSRNSAIGGGNASKRTITFTMAPRFEYKIGAWTVEGAATYSRSDNNYEALEKGHTRSNDVNNITSDFTATRPEASSYEWTIQQTSGPDWFNLANRTNPRITNEGRYARTELYTGETSAKWVTPLRKFPTQIKFGGKWNEENRKNGNETTYSTWAYNGPGGGATGSWADYVNRNLWNTGTTNILTLKDTSGQVRPDSIPRPDDNRIADLFHAHPEYFTNNATADNYYNAFIAPRRNVTQDVTAGYVMGDIRASNKLQIRTGLRWERTDNDSVDFDPRSKAEMVAAGFALNTAGRATTIPGYYYQYFSKPLVHNRTDYDNYFPMISAKYSIIRNVQFHAGFNKSIARPPTDSLGGAWIINEDTHVITSPNPNLKPEKHKNYVARLAYYPEAGEIAVTASQNDVTNLRVNRLGTPEEFGVGDDPAYAGYSFQAPFNLSGSTRTRSMDFSYRQSLIFLPPALRSTTVTLAYTRTYAAVRRQGLLPHRFTSTLGYTYKKFNIRGSVVWRSDTNWGAVTEYGYYRRHDTKMDLGGAYQINKTLSLFFQGRNIFNDGQMWMQSPNGVPRGTNAAVRVYENYGANWNFGVKGSF
jgi:iron complex outermembrane receptor protein